MSYDIYFRAKIDGTNAYTDIDTEGNHPNITYNVKELIEKSSGWHIKNEELNGPLSKWIESIYKGHYALCSNHEKFLQYESPNGWGTVEGVLSFYDKCIDAYEAIREKFCASPDVLNHIQVYVG